MISEERRIGEKLRGRILAAFPAGHYALDTFFRLTDVVISDQINTAAVECIAMPRLLLNEKFVENHCKTDEHLFMLVMHELHHVLLGHTRLFQRHTDIDNIAFDAVINALLSQLFPEPMYFSFFQKLYKPDQIPGALLRPPDGWPKEWKIPSSLPTPVREVIRVLYSQSSGTYKEVYDLLKNDKDIKKFLAEAGAGTPLLGDHAPENTPGRGESAANNPTLNETVREIVEKWPMPPDPISGRSVGSDIREILLKEVPKPPAADRVIKWLIKKMVEASENGGNTNRSIKKEDKQIEAPIPTLRDRKAFVASILGWSPLIYRNVVPQRKVNKETGLTTVYVDVSGSTRDYWALLASLVRPYVLRGLVRLFVFSEVVDDVTPTKLAEGKFKTTGGTDAICIWKHATENKFKKIIILTDGYVGKPTRHWQSKIQETKTKIRVALTPQGYLLDLEGISEEIIELPLIEKKPKEESMRTFAEWVLPGHPDKISDRIADSIVDAALTLDPNALVGIEVAVHRDHVFLDGRVACPGAEKIDFNKIIKREFKESGYGKVFPPNPEKLKIVTDLCLGDFRPDEKFIRTISDDQNIVTGFAEFNPKANHLPPAHFIAYTIARCFDEARKELPNQLGSDGKVLVVLESHLDNQKNLVHIVESVSFSIHHTANLDTVSIVTFAKNVLKRFNEDFYGKNIVPWPTEIIVNGAGDFAVGGPEGDNGLSGKKLVVDAYGPHIPIGGGALSGKDPHKIDRIMALRARQIAKHVVVAGVAERALVHLAFAPGDREPRWKEIQFGTVDYENNTTTWKVADSCFAQRWFSGYDLSIEGTFNDLSLANVCWRDLARWGHFCDPNLPWEIWNPGRT